MHFEESSRRCTNGNLALSDRHAVHDGGAADSIQALKGAVNVEVGGVSGPVGQQADGDVVQGRTSEEVKISTVTNRIDVGPFNVEVADVGHRSSGDIEADVTVLKVETCGLQGPFKVKARFRPLHQCSVQECAGRRIDDHARPQAGTVGALRGERSGRGDDCVVRDQHATVNDVDGVRVRVDHRAGLQCQHRWPFDGQVPRQRHVAAPCGIGHDGHVRCACWRQGGGNRREKEEHQQSAGSTTHAKGWSLTHIKSARGWTGVGPSGFEPESDGPQPPSIGQANPRAPLFPVHRWRAALYVATSSRRSMWPMYIRRQQ